MYYLRGSAPKSTPTPTNARPSPLTLQKLRREIRALRPSIENFSYVYTHPATTGVSHSEVSLTDVFKNSSLYEGMVLGDRYLNKYLTFCIQFAASVFHARIVVYRTRRVGTYYSWANTTTGMTGQPDPAFVTILGDFTYTPTNDTLGGIKNYKVNLKNILTIINKSSAVIEQGEIILSIITNTTGAISVPITTRMYLTNK